ncbi:MAG: YggT family protein [bacterium]|jgi:YggT family protein|nr:YggT family protein [bacterium]MDD4153711.1 YggT family protein [bacterium]MDD4558143.1 YggT family protein [bacterium]
MQLLINIVNLLFNICYYLIIADIIVSWVPDLQRTRPAEIVHLFTEPVLAPLRRLIPLPGVDISPILAIIILQVIQRFLINLLLQAGNV